MGVDIRKSLIVVILFAALFIAGCTQTAQVTGEKPTIKIGASLPLTGELAFIGESDRNAMLMAMEKTGDTKYKYEFVFEDDRMTGSEAVKTSTKLISIDKVNAIISLSSGVGNVINPIAEQNKVIHFGIASDVNIAKGRYNFIHWTQPEEEAKIWMEEARKRGINNVGAIAWNQQGFAAMMKTLREAAGDDIKITAEEKFNSGDRDFRSIILKVAESKPDVIFIGAYSPEVELIGVQIKELGINIPVSAIESFDGTEKPELFEGQWYVTGADPTGVFAEKYKDKYGNDFKITAPNAYDSVLLIVKAFESAGDGKTVPSSDSVVEELLKTRGFSGAFGEVSIGSDHVIRSNAAVKVIRNGKIVSASTEPIKIGFVDALTGDAAVYGISDKNMMDMAVDEINKQGGIYGQKLELIYEDGKCNGKDTATATQKLIDVDKVQVITGLMCSSEALAAEPIATQNKVLLFSVGASSPAITNKSFFLARDYPSDATQGKVLAEIAITKSWKNVAFIQEQTDFGVGLYKAFSNRFNELGGTTTKEEFATGTTDFRSTLTKIRAQATDAVFIDVQTPASAERILRQMRELSWKPKLLVSDSVSGDLAMVEENADMLEGALAAEFGVDKNNPKFSHMLESYNERYGSDPIYLSYAQTQYDGIYILRDAISSVGYNGEKLAAYIRNNVTNWPGASGNVTIGQNGDRIGGHVSKIIRNGKAEILNP